MRKTSIARLTAKTRAYLCRAFIGRGQIKPKSPAIILRVDENRTTCPKSHQGTRGNEGRKILHGLSGIHSEAQDRVNLDGLVAAKGRTEFPAVQGGKNPRGSFRIAVLQYLWILDIS